MGTDRGRQRDLLTWARGGGLALFVAAPLTAFVTTSALPAAVAQLLSFSTVIAVVAVLAHWRNELLEAGTALLLLLATLRIKISFGGTGYRLADIGPTVWAAGVAIVIVSVGLYREHADESLPLRVHRSHLWFGGFICWILIAIPFQTGPYPLMSVFSALFFVWPLSLSLIVVTLHGRGLDRETGVRILIIALAGHLLVAAGQILTAGPLGFWHLGEAQGFPVGRLRVGPVSLPTGPYISGFTYRGPIVTLITLSMPSLLVLASKAKRAQQRIWYIGILAGALVVLRLSRWDAAYLGAAIALLTLGLLVLAVESRRGRGTAVLLTATFVYLFSAAVLGAVRRARPKTDSMQRFQTAFMDVGEVLAPVIALSFPVLSTANLASRLQMFVVGIDLLLQHPIFGIGMANFYYVSDGIGFEQPFLMHNMVLQVLVGTGLVGGLLYSLATLEAARGTVSAFRRGESDYLVLALVAGLLGVHVQLFFQPQLLKFVSVNAIWLAIALIVGE